MRIAVSGSYSTGKTITTLILSELLGIPKTHARTMRELLPISFPGKRLDQCQPNELIELILRRNHERLIAEKEFGNSFVSDGASIQEWGYCYARLKAGFNPNEKSWKSILRKYSNYSQWLVFKEIMDSYGYVVKAYAKSNYDLIIHLPIEFPFDPDGHRPTSERFRLECDRLLRNTYKELNIEVYEVSGDVKERITKICRKLDFGHRADVNTIIKKCISNKKSLFDSIKIE